MAAIRYLVEQYEKGASKASKQSNKGDLICLLYEPNLYSERRSMKKKKIVKVANEVVLFQLEPWQQFATKICELHAEQNMFRNIAGNLN